MHARARSSCPARAARPAAAPAMAGSLLSTVTGQHRPYSGRPLRCPARSHRAPITAASPRPEPSGRRRTAPGPAGGRRCRKTPPLPKFTGIGTVNRTLRLQHQPCLPHEPPGRPWRLPTPALAAARLALLVPALIPRQASGPAVVTGLAIWFCFTARADLAPPLRR
jgi:hypothetical protein